MDKIFLLLITALLSFDSWGATFSLEQSQDLTCHLQNSSPILNSLKHFLTLGDSLTNVACQNIIASDECQNTYKQINHEGGKSEDYKLSCSDENETLKDLGAFYLGCYTGLFDAMAGDLGRFLGESVAKAVISNQDDNLCNSDIKFKRKLYQDHNIANPAELQIAIPSDSKLRAYSCSVIRDSIFQEHRYQAMILDRYKKSSPPKTSKSIIAAAKAILTNLNIKLECYNPRKQAELICTAATYITTTTLPIAASVKLKSLAGLAPTKMPAALVIETNTVKTKELLNQSIEGSSQIMSNSLLSTPVQKNPVMENIINALNKKYNIPTYTDPAFASNHGAANAVAVSDSQLGSKIVLNPEYVLKAPPEQVELTMVHETVHAVGRKKILSGKDIPDHNLTMSFQSEGNILHKSVEHYPNFFAVEEVKAYGKEMLIAWGKSKRQWAKLKANRGKNTEEDFKLFHLYNKLFMDAQTQVSNFSTASLDLLSKTEKYLTEAKEIYISRGYRHDSKLLDLYIEIKNENEAPFIFHILADSTDNIVEKILQQIKEAKKTITYYNDKGKSHLNEMLDR